MAAEVSSGAVRRPATATLALVCLLSLGWAAVLASCAAYFFLCSRLPVPDYLYAGATVPGGAAWWGPGWLSFAMIFGELSVALCCSGHG